ncbi:MAG: hypothetical protein AB7N80_15250 [Bdellovibrionales bacterium]
MVKTSKSLKVWLWSAVGVLIALLLSGLVWLVLENWVRLENEFGASRWTGQAKVLQLHGWLAAFSIFLLGTLTGLHVIPQWRSRHKRRSGASLYAIYAFLSLSGVALYYVSHERLRELTSLAHWAIGLALPLVLGAHLIQKKVKRPKTEGRK